MVVKVGEAYVIKFEDVSKAFFGYDALRNVSFEIQTGEMVFLTGHSGAGKSTLLKLIAALERPNIGIVRVANRVVNRMPKRMLPYLRRALGIIFQDHPLLFDRNVMENTLLPLAVIGIPRQEAVKRARAALDRVGLTHRERSLPIQLSGGEQQRLAIARAIVHRPSVMLADEPTANLDAQASQELLDVLHNFQDLGMTLLIATHNESLIKRYPNAKVLRLDHGRLCSFSRHDATYSVETNG